VRARFGIEFSVTLTGQVDLNRGVARRNIQQLRERQACLFGLLGYLAQTCAANPLSRKVTKLYAMASRVSPVLGSSANPTVVVIAVAFSAKNGEFSRIANPLLIAVAIQRIWLFPKYF
jgi:hypothetical protein